MEYANTRLRKVKIAPEKWETEYENPSTGEKWLLDYPHSELQGGGEPRLRKLKHAVQPGAWIQYEGGAGTVETLQAGASAFHAVAVANTGGFGKLIARGVTGVRQATVSRRPPALHVAVGIEADRGAVVAGQAVIGVEGHCDGDRSSQILGRTDRFLADSAGGINRVGAAIDDIESDGLQEKELLASDLLKLHDAAHKFGKFRIFASGG